MGSTESVSKTYESWIQLFLEFNNRDESEANMPFYDGELVRKALYKENVSISKGGSYTLTGNSLSFVKTYADHDMYPDYDDDEDEEHNALEEYIRISGDNGEKRVYPIRIYANAAYVTSGLNVKEYDAYAENQLYFLLYRLDPVVKNYTYVDNHPLDPLGHFGSFVQNRSIPELKFDVTLDPLDPSLTAVHKLMLTSPGGMEKSLETTDGIFNLDPVSESGTYTWAYTVTDSAGNSASESGSFEVLAYEPPRIDALSIQRYTQSVDDEGNPTYIPTDDGDRIWFTINAVVASVAGANAWMLKRTREDTSRQFSLLSGADGKQIVRVNDYNLDPGVYSPSDTIGITLTLSDFFETVERYEVILKAGGYLHITKVGTAVGMRSTATPELKKFEVAKDYLAFFYGGIAGVTSFVEGEQLTGGRWIDKKPIYLYVFNTDGFSLKSSWKTLFVLPDPVDTLIELTGTALNRIALPFGSLTANTYTIQLDADLQAVRIASSSEGNKPVVVKVFYTKKGG